MSDKFLSSDEYDERAHQLYNEGQYDEAIDTLREGLGLYPHSVELLVGMGYARLAREEYAWARRAFEEARGLDPDHEDMLAGLGEVLLKFGERGAALACFEHVLALGFQDDHDLMLQIGRALFREGVLDQARRFFEGALRAHPDSADAAACVGYAAHRLADEGGSLHWLRRALELDPSLGEARIYLANLLYDRGEYEAALFHLERRPRRTLRRASDLAAGRAEEERVPPSRRRSRARPLERAPQRACGRRRPRRPPALGDRSDDAGRPDPRSSPVGAVRHAAHRAARDEEQEFRGPPRQHGVGRDVRRYVGRDRAPDERRCRRVGRRIARGVH